MDRNQLVGMVLISAMMVGYFFFLQNNPEQQKTLQPVSEQVVQTNTTEPTTSEAAATPSSSEEKVVYEFKNEELALRFSNHGARIKSAELINFTDYLDQPLILFDEKSNTLDFKAGNTSLNNIVFGTPSKINTTNDTTFITFTSADSANPIEVNYAIATKGFVVKQSINLKNNANTLLALDWTQKLRRLEKGISESISKSTVNYYTTEEDFSDLGAGDETEQIETPLKWFSNKQRFFNTGLIAETSLQNVTLSTSKIENDTNFVRVNTAKANVVLDNGVASFSYYFGPNDYKITKEITEGYSKNVYMGWAVFGWVNKIVVVPIFKFLERFISNYGIIILILVIIVKLVLFPIAYRSYLSMAKMKELQPEIAKIKEEHGDDMQKVQSEQMKLYSQVGVNPLAGCIPMVLQMPILLALFNFFPNSIELRHEAFLWAPDLSTYDAPITWGFDVPFIGNHISLFTLLMTLSTLAYTYYNSQMTSAAQQGPMKYMGYFMPVIFFFVLNDFSAGLTYYYFVSNLITISQQLIAQKFIDKDKIRETMEENRKNAKAGKGKQSKFQTRLQEAMKAQQEAKKKGKK